MSLCLMAMCVCVYGEVRVLDNTRHMQFAKTDKGDLI